MKNKLSNMKEGNLDLTTTNHSKSQPESDGSVLEKLISMRREALESSGISEIAIKSLLEKDSDSLGRLAVFLQQNEHLILDVETMIRKCLGINFVSETIKKQRGFLQLIIDPRWDLIEQSR